MVRRKARAREAKPNECRIRVCVCNGTSARVYVYVCVCVRVCGHVYGDAGKRKIAHATGEMFISVKHLIWRAESRWIVGRQKEKRIKKEKNE